MTNAAPKKNTSKHPHKWRFFRSGGFDQVRLDSGADLLALDQLDPKLWAALSCPTYRLHLDDKTLELMDTDRDGRIRVPEILEAIPVGRVDPQERGRSHCASQCPAINSDR